MSAVPTHLFVLAVVADRGRYLIVEERDGTFYLPAGKVELGEDLVTAAARETLEEAAVPIAVHGLLGFDHESLAGRARMRFVFAASASGGARPKAFADHHSRGARWATPEEIAALPLRHAEVRRWVALHEEVVARRRALLPLEGYEAHGFG